MLNFRKLRQDISSAILKEGKDLFEEGNVHSAKILHIDSSSIRITGQVVGQYNNTYSPEIEVDRMESELIDSDCDCPYQFDCSHIAALLFYLEKHLDAMLVDYSEETDLDDLAEEKGLDDEEKEKLLEVVKEAASKEEIRKDEQYQRELLDEYIVASNHLSTSPFFLPKEEKTIERCDLAIIVSGFKPNQNFIEFQLALRLASRSKPLYIPHLRFFSEAVAFVEPIVISGKKYYFSFDSFHKNHQRILRFILDHTQFADRNAQDRQQKFAKIERKRFGQVLAMAFEIGKQQMQSERRHYNSDDPPRMPCVFYQGLENPLCFGLAEAKILVNLEYIQPPANKLLLNPQLVVEKEVIQLEDVLLFESETSGLVYANTYFPFQEGITRKHLRSLYPMREITVPEPLFGTFIENSLPELLKFAKVGNQEVLEDMVSIPNIDDMKAVCELSYLNGELEAKLAFNYGRHLVPSATKDLTYEHIASFVSDEGVLSRNLVAESNLKETLFEDFLYDPQHEMYVAKTEKKIIEFMTDTLPKFQDTVEFHCPPNLLDQFIYDDTTYKLSLTHIDRMDAYNIKMEVNGALKGVKMDRLWDCIVSKRAYVELEKTRAHDRTKLPKILVLDLEKISKLVQLFDELGITKLDSHSVERPLWSLASIDGSQFKDLPVKFTMSTKLREIRKQMLGEKKLEFSKIPEIVQADLRNYQVDGVNWLERLRSMFLSGILADDMGLGKTLQAIVAVTQHLQFSKEPALVVCPTSLVYNWKEEFSRFNPNVRVLIVDGMPGQRKKLLETIDDYDVIVTSYSLLQKDVDLYKTKHFSYFILDEAQHIKNRGTRNAKSVKMIQASHRLILSGTPIENSLDELWSLFDFLMPGFLSSYERFLEKYVRCTADEHMKNMEYLRKKVSPFILRRMKTDVLKDLPPVSDITYRCHLTKEQEALYRSYAQSARDELVKLVERDGFDKVQIHVLATLTRLKQICCHPAIFAKEQAEYGDSAKYDMLLDLLESLIEGKHKTVIFSQYTRMLQIMRDDFQTRGIPFLYLDGSSKNRLEIVKQFNEDDSIPVFLVSLKAGGTGLNLVGADTVIHYDMWWNPAVEAQATDRVHRLGQNKSVSVYKLVTMGTIEEKIVEMQNRKRGIVKKIVSCDDEAITKLTWEDVLELLQT